MEREEGFQVSLIVEPDDGIGPVISAINKAQMMANSFDTDYHFRIIEIRGDECSSRRSAAPEPPSTAASFGVLGPRKR